MVVTRALDAELPGGPPSAGAGAGLGCFARLHKVGCERPASVHNAGVSMDSSTGHASQQPQPPARAEQQLQGDQIADLEGPTCAWRGSPAPPRMWATAPRTALRPSRSTRKRQSRSATRSGLQGANNGRHPSRCPQSAAAKVLNAAHMSWRTISGRSPRVSQTFDASACWRSHFPEQDCSTVNAVNPRTPSSRVSLTCGRSLRRRTRGGPGGSRGRAGARSRR